MFAKVEAIVSGSTFFCQLVQQEGKKKCFQALPVSFVYTDWLRPCPYLTGSLCPSGSIFRLVLVQQRPFFKLRVGSISSKTQGRDGRMNNIPKEIKRNVTRVNEKLVLGIKQETFHYLGIS